MLPTLVILNALLPGGGPSPATLCDIACLPNGEWSAKRAAEGFTPTPQDGPFSSVSRLSIEGETTFLDVEGSLLLVGGLTHPHLHLDKCFLLDRCELVEGTFAEALTSTSEAKRGFTTEDLLSRGRRLIRDSLSHGVTTMRAHVEVDPIVKLKCFQAGTQLQKSFSASCSIHLVAFAQDPFFPSSPDTEQEMEGLFQQVISNHNSAASPLISAIGSAPYVESTRPLALRNIAKVFALARLAKVDVDFHLDYDLDPSLSPLVWDVLRVAQLPENTWTVAGGRTRRITLGHCTKLSLFSDGELDRLAEEVVVKLQGSVHFVALPPSDMYMQGRGTPYATRSRATFPALELVKRGIPCSIGVNNVANAFTPQGDADPLALLPLLVGIWQNAKPATLNSLLEMVTSSASNAAGAPSLLPNGIFSSIDEMGKGPATFTLLDGCRDVRSAVLAPGFGRTTVFEGRVVGRRVVESRVEEGL